MYLIIVFLFAIFLEARDISGYDSRYNNIKYFCIENSRVAKLLLPKRSGFRRHVKRIKADFNKMTYAGAVFYSISCLSALAVSILLFFVHEISIHPYVVHIWRAVVVIDTLNKKISLLLLFIVFALEIICVCVTSILQARKDKKGIAIFIYVILIAIFSLSCIWQVEELISTIAGVI